ncbi:MAG: PQQ-like beta-propeller repeat protein [Thermoflexales bacterium]|nr:PQQ-like beta-propeller repeat protein [Thermoflexales bacterium]
MKRTFRISLLAAFTVLTLGACGGEITPTSFPGLTLDGKDAYLASNLHVYKFDSTTGAQAWIFPAAEQNGGQRPGPFAGPPLKFGDAIIVGETLDMSGRTLHRLYALSASNGVELWRFSGGQREYTDGASTDGKLIFAPNGDNTLYALDPSRLEGGEPKVAWKFTAQNKLWVRPQVANGKVFQPSLDHNLYALDAATGQLLWTFSTGASIASHPAIADGVLYFGSFDQHMYAVDAETGAQVWRSPERLGGWIWCDPLLDGDEIFVGDVKGGVYALDRRTGKVLWRSQVGGAIRARPVIVGDKLYVVSSDTYLYSFDRRPVADASGYVPPTRVLENGLVRRLLSTPAPVNGALLVPLFDGDIKVTAVDLESKQKKFEFPLRSATP